MGLVCRCKRVDCMTRSYKLVYRRFREDDASKGGVGSHWMKIEARVLFNLQAFLGWWGVVGMNLSYILIFEELSISQMQLDCIFPLAQEACLFILQSHKWMGIPQT